MTCEEKRSPEKWKYIKSQFNHLTPQELNNNEYLNVDHETFKKLVHDNREKIRARLRELNLAKKVYLDLLNFNKQ